MHRFRHGMVAVAAWMAAVAAPAVAAPPPNDMFENAMPLGDPPVEVSTTTFSASRQPGEPIHGQQTVWYAYRPTVSQRVAVEAQAPDGSPRVVAVYTGSSLPDLERVGIGESSEARVPFDATAGQTYWIATGRTYEHRPLRRSHPPDAAAVQRRVRRRDHSPSSRRARRQPGRRNDGARRAARRAHRLVPVPRATHRAALARTRPAAARPSRCTRGRASTRSSP